MRKGNLFTDKRSLFILLTVIILIVIDLFSKEWIRTYPLGELIQQIGFVKIIHIQNTGAAFGIFQGYPVVLAIVVVIEVLVLLTLAYFIYDRHPQLVTRWNMIALGLILGGALGNLIDRLRFDGAVTDFLDVGIWPAFNAADSGVTIGAVMITVTILRLAMKEKRENT